MDIKIVEPDIRIITAGEGASSYKEWNEALKEEIPEKYIMFLKPGIAMDEEAPVKMAREMDISGVDMVSAGYLLRYDAELLQKSPERVKRVFSGEDMLCRIFYLQNEQGFLFNKLVKTDIIREGRLRFDEKIGAGAERLFLVRYLKRSELVLMLPDRITEWDLSMTPPGYDNLSRKAFSKMKRALFFHGDARYLCRMDRDYLDKELIKDEEV